MKLGKDYVQECEKAGDYRLVKIAKVYAEYERRLREANALISTTSSWTPSACSRILMTFGSITRKIPLCTY